MSYFDLDLDLDVNVDRLVRGKHSGDDICHSALYLHMSTSKSTSRSKSKSRTEVKKFCGGN